MNEKIKSAFQIICIVCLPLIVFGGVYYFADSTTLSEVKDFGECIQPIIEIIAIIIAGIWTYRVFIKNRTDYPVLETTHHLSHYPINDNFTLLCLNVTLKNISNVLVKINFGEVFIQQIIPFEKTISKKIETSEFKEIMDGNVKEVFLDNNEIQWFEIGHRENDGDRLEIKIEPDESEEVQYEFLIKSDIEVVKVISFYANPKIKDLGWRKTTIYSIRK